MGQAATLRPEEVVLFEGDLVLLKSKINVVQTQGWITNQRLYISDGKRTVEKLDLATVSEEKYGLGKKVAFTLRDGTTINMTAANGPAFLAAANVLAGQSDISTMPTQPALSAVKNGTAWLAAVGPLIASFVGLMLGTMLWGDVEHWRTGQLLQALLVKLVVMWLFMRIDYLKLQGQGYNVKQMGLADPIAFPVYLFSRAKVFKQGKGPAIVWSLLIGLDILLTFV